MIAIQQRAEQASRGTKPLAKSLTSCYGFSLIQVHRELSPWRVLQEGVHYCIAGGVMVLVFYFVTAALTPTITPTALIVVVGAAVFATLLLERDEFLLSNIKRVLVRLHR